MIAAEIREAREQQHRWLAPSAVCHCVECRRPCPENRDIRLVHAERHQEFARRYSSRVTDAELGMWIAMKRLQALEHTEPVGQGQCRRPDHAMLIPHPSHLR